MSLTIAMFGEAEKRGFQFPCFVSSLQEMEEKLGNPPKGSIALYLAVQALLYQRDIVFFRVEEEGFSLDDYHMGLQVLQHNTSIKKINALCMPGVGDPSIIESTKDICLKHKSLLITSEQDLYDYLTSTNINLS